MIRVIYSPALQVRPQIGELRRFLVDIVEKPCKRSWRRYSRKFHGSLAGVAQPAELRFCKPRVVSSSLTASFVGGGSQC